MSSKLEHLESKVRNYLTPKRFNHVLGVRDMAILLARACLPEMTEQLAVAALLHDITKEKDTSEQISMLEELGVKITEDDLKSPEILHSYTAEYVILRDFSEFSTPEILSSIRKHTTGDAQMTAFDRIIFISDYIEYGRKYESCIRVRDYLLSALADGESKHNLRALTVACIMAIDFTVENLSARGKSIHPTTLLARKALVSEK